MKFVEEYYITVDPIMATTMLINVATLARTNCVEPKNSAKDGLFGAETCTREDVSATLLPFLVAKLEVLSKSIYILYRKLQVLL